MAATLTPAKPATAKETISRRRLKGKAVNFLEGTLRQQAEYYLGAKIGSSEWVEAKEYAERKLKGIIEREGDENGARREPWYLAQLIAETVKTLRRICDDTSDMGMWELAHNHVFIKNGEAWYRDFEREISVLDLMRGGTTNMTAKQKQAKWIMKRLASC